MHVDSPAPLLQVPPGAPPVVAAVIDHAQHAIQQLTSALPPTGSSIAPPPMPPMPRFDIPDPAALPAEYHRKTANLEASLRDLTALGAQTTSVVSMAAGFAGDALRDVGVTVAKLNDQLTASPIHRTSDGELMVTNAHANILRDLDVAVGDVAVSVTVTDHLIRTAADRITRALLS
ncbi:MAG: hypothetical protein HOQ24_05880 [Mycobacteriaceae bacterium]|nr:hypothetical protein [Mycobacteriaceae bacterium]